MAPRDLSAEHAADGAVAIADAELDLDRLPALQGRLGERDELVVERSLEPVVLIDGAADVDGLGDVGAVEQHREVEAPGLPVVDRGAGVEAVDATDHVVETAEPEGSHVTAHVLGEE